MYEVDDWPDELSVCPRDIMRDMFALQIGTMDRTPLQLERLADAIIDHCNQVVERTYGDGKHRYHCFLSYRKASDLTVAEELFKILKTRECHVFLDTESLRIGQEWRQEFRRVFENCAIFVALMSPKGLAPARDFGKDHSGDSGEC
jgi:TIR domain